MPQPQSTPSHIVGLSLADTETQAVELSRESAIPSIRAIAEWHGGMEEEPASIVQRLLSFMKANHVATDRIAVTVDTAALFTHVLPVPAGQTTALMHKHAHWDITQFFPEARDGEFITEIHLLKADTTPGMVRLLSVSVRRVFARALQKALTGEGLELHVLDGDHFSAEHYLTSRHPDGRTGIVALAGLKRERMDISVLRDGNLIDYGAWGQCTPDACAARITSDTDAHAPVERVFLYGPRATQNMVDALRAHGLPAIEVLNPFAGMEIVPGNPLATHFLAMPHRFVPAVGAALREE